MKRLGFCVIFFLLAASAEMVSSQVTKRTEIVGLPPYVFSASAREILSVDPTLQQVPPVWINVLHYRGPFDYILSGYVIPGTISLHFWDGQLAYVEIVWVNLRSDARRFIRTALSDSYALQSMKVTRNIESDLDFEDSLGNRVGFVTYVDARSILLYQWLIFRKANVPLAPKL